MQRRRAYARPSLPAADRKIRQPDLSQTVDAQAEVLPLADGAFEVTMATFTVHQWADLAAGLREMRRVTRGPVVVLSCDPIELRRCWLHDYAPEMIEVEARRYPPIDSLAWLIGGQVEVWPVPIPLHCSDGFGEAYYGRPERLLEPGARRACLAWSFVETAVVERFVSSLARDLASGEWDRRHGALRTQPHFEGSLTLIVGRR